MRKYSFILLLAIIGLFSQIQESCSECCVVPCGSCDGNYCNGCDKMRSENWGMTHSCGVGGCNIFNCNCDGGCKKGIPCDQCMCPKPPTLLTASPVSGSCEHHVEASKYDAQSVLRQADQNGDSVISFDEFKQWLPPVPKDSPIDLLVEFDKIDENGDGVVSLYEIDPPSFQ